MQGIFQSAVNRLTLWYVGILLVVCIILSTPIYLFASNRIEGNTRRQTQVLQQLPGFRVVPNEIEELRDTQIHRDRQQLLNSLVLINIVILSSGAYLSYLFAKRTLKPIEEAHEAQTRFTTDASHELRTPLAVMQAEIEVALREKKLSLASAKEVLSSNLEEIERLHRLSEQLLNLTRLDGKAIDKKSVDLSTLVLDEVAQAQQQTTNITQTIGKHIKTQGDKHLLRELLKILLDNAAKYGDDKPVEVSLKKQDNQALLSITDHGIGIKASELEHIFDRFYRGSNASQHSASGHGLGLALAQQIVSAHGGAITAVSSAGNQTTFSVNLPAA